MSLIDELRASWPPGDPAATSDHVRPSAAGTRLLDACALPSTAIGWHAVAVASDADERLRLVLLVRSGGTWHRARAGDGASQALVATLARMEPLSKDFRLHSLGRPRRLGLLRRGGARAPRSPRRWLRWRLRGRSRG